jgi:hypothetical protein
MSGTLSSTTASALAPILQGLQIGSTGYNLYNQYQNQQYQNTLRQDAQNPAKVNALAAQYTQPLTAGLTAAVNNQTQAQLAQAGLSESPQIAQTVEAQAIAPYIQQNQQQGYTNAIQALGLGGGAIPPQIQGANNLSALAKAFSQLPGANGAAALKQLLQLNQNGGQQAPSLQTPNPDLGGQTIPDQPIQPFDFSSFYQPDYAAAGGVGYGDNSD